MSGKHKGRPCKVQKRNILCNFPANSYPTTKPMPWHNSYPQQQLSDDECDILSIGVYFDSLRTNWLDEDGSHCNEEQELEVMVDKQLAAELTLMLEELDEKDPDWIPKTNQKAAKKSELSIL